MHTDGRFTRRTGGVVLALALTASAVLVTAREDKDENGKAPPGAEWAYWGGDAGSTRYSPLDQINAANVGTLQVMWR